MTGYPDDTPLKANLRQLDRLRERAKEERELTAAIEAQRRYPGRGNRAQRRAEAAARKGK